MEVLIRSFCTEQTEAFSHGSFYTQTPVYAEAFTQKRSEKFHTQKLFQTDAFTHRSFCAQTPLHKEALQQRKFTRRNFYPEPLLHTFKEEFTQRILDAEELLHTEAFMHRSSCTEMLLHTEAFTRKSLYTSLHRSWYTEKPFHRAAFTRFISS